jgi:hypothetical protein
MRPGALKIAKELEEAKQILAALAPESRGASESEDPVWRAYVKVETCVVMLKMDIGEDSPGKFVPIPRKPPGPSELVEAAISSIEAGLGQLQQGQDTEALSSLRSGRNNLRIYLREKQLARTRRKRAGTKSGKP